MTKKKIISMIIAVIAIIAIGISVYFVSTLSDIPQEENPTDENTKRTVVYSDDVSLFEKMTVTNENGSYSLIKDGENIVIEGRENISLLPATSRAVFEAFSEVYSVGTVSEESVDGFGFDSPSAILSLKKNDGSEKVLYIGDLAPNTNGCRYMNFKGENKVYLLDKERANRYLSGKTALYSKTVSKKIDSANLISLSIVKEDGEEIFIRPSTEEEYEDINFISGFTMEKPFIFGASSDMVVSLCDTLSSLPSAEIVEDDIDEQKLADYGISSGKSVTVKSYFDTATMIFESGEINPYYDENNKSGVVEITTVYKLGKTQENKIYFTYDNIPIIYSLEKSAFDFVNTDTYQYCQRLIHIAYITDLKGLTVDCLDGNKKVFSINSETDENGDKNISSVSADYKAVDVDNFKSFYLDIVSVSHSNIGTKPENAECVLHLEYLYSDGKNITVEFFRLPEDSRKAFMTVNGEGHFIVLMTKVDKIKNDFQKLINGETISVE